MDAGKVPKDWKGAVMIPLYKGKGIRKLCRHYQRINLHLTEGKILLGILLSQLNAHIVETILPWSQWAFQPDRRNRYAFSQYNNSQRSCMNNNKILFQFFIDLTKAFEIVVMLQSASCSIFVDGHKLKIV